MFLLRAKTACLPSDVVTHEQFFSSWAIRARALNRRLYFYERGLRGYCIPHSLDLSLFPFFPRTCTRNEKKRKEKKENKNQRATAPPGREREGEIKTNWKRRARPNFEHGKEPEQQKVTKKLNRSPLQLRVYVDSCCSSRCNIITSKAGRQAGRRVGSLGWTGLDKKVRSTAEAN